MLAIITKMTLTQVKFKNSQDDTTLIIGRFTDFIFMKFQVSTWFANARRRLKKENKMTWVPKNRATDGEDDDSKNGEDEKGKY